MCDKHALKKFRTLAFEANYGTMLETQEKVHEFLNEKEFVLNLDKTELIFFEERNTLEKIIYREETISAKEYARNLGVLVDRSLTFAAEGNKYSSKMVVAIESIYCVRATYSTNH